MPSSTLWSRAFFAFACAILGTWVFVWFIQRIQFKDVVMVPLVGIMFGNVIGGITNYLSYKYEMTQAMSSWLVGHFSIVLSGNYELVWLSVPLVVLAFVFANHFNIVAMFKGDKIRGTLVDTALFGAIFVLVCDMIARVVIAPYELPIELIVGIIGSVLFIGLLLYRLKHGRKAIRLGAAHSGACASAVSQEEGGRCQ